MHVLLTNDDGIAAPGIWEAARVLADFGRVTVVAPASNYSGYGAALPPLRSLSYYPYPWAAGHPAKGAAFSVAGTPATCVHAALRGAFGGPFDLVVSGINKGANVGGDVFYSGTVGAALTAHLLGLPAIAISLDAGPAWFAHWDTAAWALDQVMQIWLDSPTDTILNVNVPNVPTGSLAGTVVAQELSDLSCLTKYHFDPDPHLANTLTVTRNDADGAEPAPWTDVWALARGYVSITTLRAVPGLVRVAPRITPPETITLPRLSLPLMAA